MGDIISIIHWGGVQIPKMGGTFIAFTRHYQPMSCKSSFAAFDDGVLIRDPNFIEHSVSELFLDLCREQDPIEATQSNDQPSLNEHLTTGGIARCFVVTVAPNAWVLKLPWRNFEFFAQGSFVEQQKVPMLFVTCDDKHIMDICALCSDSRVYVCAGHGYLGLPHVRGPGTFKHQGHAESVDSIELKLHSWANHAEPGEHRKNQRRCAVAVYRIHSVL